MRGIRVKQTFENVCQEAWTLSVLDTNLDIMDDSEDDFRLPWPMRLYVEIWQRNDRMHQQVKSKKQNLKGDCPTTAPLGSLWLLSNFLSEIKRLFHRVSLHRPRCWTCVETTYGCCITTSSYSWASQTYNAFTVLTAESWRSRHGPFIGWPIWSNWTCRKMPCERYPVKLGSIQKHWWDSIFPEIL